MPFWLAQWCASPQIWLNNWFLHHGVKMSLDNHTLRCTPHGHATTQCALILGTLKAFTLIRQMVNLSERAVTGLQSMIDNSVNYQVIRRRTFWSTVWFLSISSGMFACVCECLALRLLWLWCHPHPNDFIKQLCLESDVTFYLTLTSSRHRRHDTASKGAGRNNSNCIEKWTRKKCIEDRIDGSGPGDMTVKVTWKLTSDGHEVGRLSNKIIWALMQLH